MDIIATVFGIVVSALFAVIAWNQQSTKKVIEDKINELADRLESQDNKIELMEKQLAVCKQNCFQEFTKKEDWLREAGNNREQLSDMSKTLSRMEGKMGIMEQLPNICGNIAREIAREMKGQVNG